MIHLDSAHEIDETFIETKVAWVLLLDVGTLFGDNWGWKAVEHDLRKSRVGRSHGPVNSWPRHFISHECQRG
jgi:hypothetical protein